MSVGGQREENLKRTEAALRPKFGFPSCGYLAANGKLLRRDAEGSRVNRQPRTPKVNGDGNTHPDGVK